MANMLGLLEVQAFLYEVRVQKINFFEVGALLLPMNIICSV